MMVVAAAEAEEGVPLGEEEQTFAFLLALRAQGVSDLPVLRAMERVPRQVFAPPRCADLARTDVSIPLPCGQTMTPPTLVASMLVDLQAMKGHRVLEIGSGSGYVSALLAELGAYVVSLERFQTLALAAHERLIGLGVRTVELQHADGLQATRLLGRFDRVLLNGVVDQVPDALYHRLAPGGRLVGAVRIGGLPHRLTALRAGEGSVDQHIGGPIRITPLLPGVAETL
jgi:protein-L-isoaspartate(D-aspartate) O-methyltransferase